MFCMQGRLHLNGWLYHKGSLCGSMSAAVSAVTVREAEVGHLLESDQRASAATECSVLTWLAVRGLIVLRTPLLSPSLCTSS